VLTEQRFVTRPHPRDDALELALGLLPEIRRPLQLVLRSRDRRADRAGREELLADTLLGHRLPQERALVALVVDREAAVEPHERPVVPQEPRAERVEGAH